MTTSTPWPNAGSPPSKLADITDASPAIPGNHASDHTAERQRVNALIDKVTGILTGDVDVPGAVEVAKAGTLISTRPRINLIQGSNVTLTVADNPGANRADVTIAAAAGAASGVTPFLVAAADAPTSWKDAAAYICDGTGDQAEIAAAELAALNSGAGGMVFLSPGTFNVAANSPIKKQGRVWLRGCGWATALVPQGTWSDTVNGAPSAVIRLLWNSGLADDSAYGEAWGLSHLRIDGGYKNCHGIYLRVQANGTFWPSAPGNKDTHIRMNDLWIGNVGKNGIHGYALSNSGNDWQRIGSTHVTNVDIMNPTGSGVYIEDGWVDSFWHSVNVGSPGAYGFYVHGNDHYFTGSKAWYATEASWYIAGNHNALDGCRSQNGHKHGAHITGDGNTFNGFLADADGQASGTWAGMYVVGDGNSIAGASVVNDTSPGWLDYGYWYTGNHNVILGTWRSNGHGTAATNGTLADNWVTVKSF